MKARVFVHGCRFPLFSEKQFFLIKHEGESDCVYLVLEGNDKQSDVYIEEGEVYIRSSYNNTPDITIRGGVYNHIYCEFDKANQKIVAKVKYVENSEITKELADLSNNDELKKDEKPHEYRMRCNVCGHVFCYNDEDVSKNIKNASVGAISAIGGLASILGGGTIFHTNHLQGQADRYTDKIVDYSRCPSCNSTDIVEITEEEINQQQNNTPLSTSSPTDEIKKYKELLDMGIITQEEFDTKKKQLLGL